MQPTSIFLPALAMVLLSAIVTFRMFFERVRQVKAEKISFRDIPSGSQMAVRFTDTRAADNYRNLFEAPVLFYLALVVAFASAQVTALTLGLAWGYVVLRYVHSYIHCGYNRISHRLYVFLASNVVLWLLWALLLVGLLRG
ncbi:MAG: MAPEG family protein [Lysobacter sp.]|nr:MAPEG family protein [Lysobacter sp.]MDQ3269829.1 MAPEG family protein [Pseudomonadota bacterium]